MRQGPSGRRGRGRSHSGGNGGQGGGHGGHGNGGQSGTHHAPRRSGGASLRNQSFDSNGPGVRVRGNAWQVYEKYLSFARDASSAGDRVVAENFFQHAEHYYRITEAINEATAEQQQARGYTPQQPQPDSRAPYYPPSSPGGDGQAEVRGNLAFAASGQEHQPDLNQATVTQTGNAFFSPDADEADDSDPDVPAAVTGRR